MSCSSIAWSRVSCENNSILFVLNGEFELKYDEIREVNNNKPQYTQTFERHENMHKFLCVYRGKPPKNMH